MNRKSIFILLILVLGSIPIFAFNGIVNASPDISADAYSTGITDGSTYSGDIPVSFSFGSPMTLEIYVDGQMIRAYINTVSASFTIRSQYWPNGWHNVTFTSFPDGDRSLSDIEEYFVNFNNAMYTPVLTSNLTKGQYVEGTVGINVTTLESGTINVYVDNQYVMYSTITSTHVFYLDTTGWSDGNHTIRFIFATSIGQFDHREPVIFNNLHFSTNVVDNIVMHDHFRINANLDVGGYIDVYVDGEYTNTWDLMFWMGSYSFAEELDTTQFSTGSHRIGLDVHPSGYSNYLLEYDVIFSKGLTVDFNFNVDMLNVATSWDRQYNYNFYVDGAYLSYYSAVFLNGEYVSSFEFNMSGYSHGMHDIEMIITGPGFDQYSVFDQVFYNALHFSTNIFDNMVMHDHFRINANLDVGGYIDVYVDGQYTNTWDLMFWMGSYSFAEELDTTQFSTGNHNLTLHLFPSGYVSSVHEYNVTFARGLSVNFDFNVDMLSVTTSWDRQYNYNFYVDGAYLSYYSAVFLNGEYVSSFEFDMSGYSHGWHNIELIITGASFDQYSVFDQVFYNALHFSTNVVDNIVMHDHFRINANLDVSGFIDVYVDGEYTNTWDLMLWMGSYSFAEELDTTKFTTGNHILTLQIYPNGYGSFSFEYNVTFATGMTTNLVETTFYEGEVTITTTWFQQYQYNFYIDNAYITYTTANFNAGVYETSIVLTTTDYSDGWHEIEFIVTGAGFDQYSVFIKIFFNNLHFQTNLFQNAELFASTDVSLSLDVSGSVDIWADGAYLFTTTLNPWNGYYANVAVLDVSSWSTGVVHEIKLVITPDGMASFDLRYDITVGIPMYVPLENPNSMAGSPMISLIWDRDATVNFYVDGIYHSYYTLTEYSGEFSTSFTFNTTEFSNGDHVLQFIVSHGGVQYSLYFSIIINNESIVDPSDPGDTTDPTSDPNTSDTTTSETDPESTTDPVDSPELELPSMTFMYALFSLLTSTMLVHVLRRRRN